MSVETINKKQPVNLSSYLSQYKNQMAQALPKHLTIDRMLRMVMTEVRKTPKLQECSVSSFIGSVLACCQVGLEPGILGHAYLIPYKKECQFMLGYKGMIELVRRSGSVRRISARVVCENDEFDYSFGIIEKCIHKECPDYEKRGNVKGAYVVVEFKDGGHQFDYMSASEINEIRENSSSYSYWVRNGKNGEPPIWEQHYEELAKKTVIRRMFKYLPISVEIQQAITYDEFADVGKQKTMLSAEFEEVLKLEQEEKNEFVATGVEKLADKLAIQKS